MKMNKVQTAAYELIQADARFIYTLTDIARNAGNINSNYLMMCQPYIGVFADGAEQWCKKTGLNAPMFNGIEKDYYTALRQSHKLLEKNYTEFADMLMRKLDESDRYFYSIRSGLERLIGYYNVGTDLCNGEFCGNTILCAAYLPVSFLGKTGVGITIRDLSVITGKLSAFFGCKSFPPYRYDDINNTVVYKDYHFFDHCPIKEKTELGFVLFSILCSINYTIAFMENYFVDEIPQKFKFAYLQYYYLCGFVEDMNKTKNTSLVIDQSLKNRAFRNCLAHYGLGQYMEEKDIIEGDVLKGLTNKAFHLDYDESKLRLFEYLNQVKEQIRMLLFT